MRRYFVLVFVLVVVRITRADEYVQKAGYGVDVSFPMQNGVKNKEGKKRYDAFMDGCSGEGGVHRKKCEANERARMAMNRDQIPRQKNYTSLGFGKLRAPEPAYRAARDFYEKYKDRASEEAWPAGNTYVNNWESATKMVSFEDGRFQPDGFRAKDIIWSSVQPVLEAWTGQKLKPTSLYGVRRYHDKAILATHVDRLPLVTSAIINVDQNVSKPWPIEVIGHDGEAYQVSLNPGDMAMYESHTVLHGRPEPMEGDFFANCFVHFIPVDPLNKEKNEPGIDFNWQKNAKQIKHDPIAFSQKFPPPRLHDIALDDAKTAAENQKKYKLTPPQPLQKPATKEFGHQVMQNGEDFGKEAFGTGSVTALHVAAAQHNLKAIIETVRKNPDAVNSRDSNAWTPLHESARAGGDTDVIETLLNSGSDLGARTISGSTALWIAKQHQNSKIVAFLESIGAPEIPDDEL